MTKSGYIYISDAQCAETNEISIFRFFFSYGRFRTQSSQNFLSFFTLITDQKCEYFFSSKRCAMF